MKKLLSILVLSTFAVVAAPIYWSPPITEEADLYSVYYAPNLETAWTLLGTTTNLQYDVGWQRGWFSVTVTVDGIESDQELCLLEWPLDPGLYLGTLFLGGHP